MTRKRKSTIIYLFVVFLFVISVGMAYMNEVSLFYQWVDNQNELTITENEFYNSFNHLKVKYKNDINHENSTEVQTIDINSNNTIAHIVEPEKIFDTASPIYFKDYSNTNIDRKILFQVNTDATGKDIVVVGVIRRNNKRFRNIIRNFRVEF